MKTIPYNIIPKQVNLGDTLGDIWASYNIDLTGSLGKIRTSRKLSTNYNVSGSSAVPVAFVRNLSGSASADTYFGVCNGKIISTPASNLNGWADDGISGSPTTAVSGVYSDAESFNNNLVVSLKTDVAQLASGVWDDNWWTGTIGGSALTDSKPHPLKRIFNNLLLIGNGHLVASVDISNNYNNTKLTFPLEYEIQWIESSNSMAWIGCRHRWGGRAKVFSWNGSDESFTNDYEIGTDNVLSAVIYNENPYVVDGTGRLLNFNGGGFEEVARFPIANEKTNRFQDGAGTIPMNINRNGMAVIDNKINILVSAGINGNNHELLENMVSGIWEYTSETGLYHKYSITKGNETTIYDYGSPSIVQAGALFDANDSTNATKTFLAGASLNQSGSSDGRTVICYLGRATNRTKMAYVITPKLYGSQIEEMWKKIAITYSKLATTGDFITVKYRTSVDYTDTFDQLGTWTSTTTFTTTATEFSGVAEGDEIEILAGEGSGLSASITDITGTYTVTIDTAVTGASGTFKFRTANWTKLDSITDLVTRYKEVSVGENANWVQFKVILYGVGGATDVTENSPEIEKLFIISEPQIKAI